jgi:hypothetical protein
MSASRPRAEPSAKSPFLNWEPGRERARLNHERLDEYADGSAFSASLLVTGVAVSATFAPVSDTASATT